MFSTISHDCSRNAQVESGVWEFDGTLNVKAGSTIKIIGQVGGHTVYPFMVVTSLTCSVPWIVASFSARQKVTVKCVLHFSTDFASKRSASLRCCINPVFSTAPGGMRACFLLPTSRSSSLCTVKPARNLGCPNNYAPTTSHAYRVPCTKETSC